MTQIEALAATLNQHGLKASVWRGQRIYINGLGKDIKAYIAFDEPDTPAEDFDYLYNGCCLKVWSTAEQDAKWLINRRKQVKHSLMQQIHGAGVCGNLEAPCEDWRAVIL